MTGADTVASVRTGEPYEALKTDQSPEILRFARARLARGEACALVTLTGIVDGAARALGSHMAVAQDGGHCGYISGGCVEAAVAREAMEALAEGRDRVLRLGKGSDIFDIVLPCRGGIVLSIHCLGGTEALDAILAAQDQRESVSLSYDPAAQALSVLETPVVTGWHEGRFVTFYAPPLHIAVLGGGIEARFFAGLVQAGGMSLEELSFRNPPDPVSLDEHTAVVLLQHDIDKELPILHAALASRAFYIGCLGSRNTHRQRCEALLERGWTDDDLARIRAPIGLFGPARDAFSIAVSVIAEIVSLTQAAKEA